MICFSGTLVSEQKSNAGGMYRQKYGQTDVQVYIQTQVNLNVH